MCASFAGDTRTSSNGCQVAKRIMRENARHPLDSRRTTKNIAAIDFGTAFCSVAYSTQDNGENVTMLALDTGSEREPTAILFDKEGKCHSFGQEARDNIFYADDANRIDFDFFEQIKMNLQDDKDVNRDMKITSSSGKVFFLIDVIAHILNYLKNVLLDRLEDANLQLLATDFHWVITVPAIWQARGKQLMREAGYKAGLCSGFSSIGPKLYPCTRQAFPRFVNEKYQERLTIIHESEAAIACCQSLQKTELKHCAPDDHSTYMLVDIGGGTVDISIYKHVVTENPNDNVIELTCSPGGGPFGGNTVNDEFLQFLSKEVVCDDGFSSYLNTQNDQMNIKHNVLLKELKNVTFETQKKIYGRNKARSTCVKKATVALPPTFLHIYKERIKHTLSTNSSLNEHVELQDQNLMVSYTKIETFFKVAVDGIIQTMLNAVERSRGEGNEVKTIYLVGGFGMCNYVHDQIKENFTITDYHYVIPLQADRVVVKGAVFYRQNPSLVQSRRSDFSYGVSGSLPFNPQFHHTWQREQISGQALCRNLFITIVKKAEIIRAEEVFCTTHQPESPDQKQMVLEVFTSNSQEVKHIEKDNCTKIGDLTIPLIQVDIPGAQGESCARHIDITFDFTYSELRVLAFDSATPSCISGVLDYLS